MTQYERRLIDTLLKYRDILFPAMITAIAVFVRFTFLDFVSGDMGTFLLPWFEEIQAAGGLPALSQQVGDYNIMYQFLICLFSYLPTQSAVFSPMHLYKYLSILFDLLLACTAGLLVAHIKQKNKALWFNITYAVMVMLPTVAVNSALWGQCDSIYTFFMLASLLFFLQRKDLIAFVMLGFSFVFKLQAIFILPFYVIAYFYFRRFSLGLFAVPVILLWLSGIPAFLYGRSLLSPFLIYLNQTVEYGKMYMNVVSFWQLLGDSYGDLFKYAVLLTMTILGTGLYAVLCGAVKLDTDEAVIAAACWCVWTCVLFLPAMHDRYTYPTDILLVLLTFFNRKYLKFALPQTCFSLITYGKFLLANSPVNIWCALLSVGLWLWFTMDLLPAKAAVNTSPDHP